MTQTSRSPFSRMAARSALALLTAAGLAGALSACSSHCCRPAPTCGCSAPASTLGPSDGPHRDAPGPRPHAARLAGRTDGVRRRKVRLETVPPERAPRVRAPLLGRFPRGLPPPCGGRLPPFAPVPYTVVPSSGGGSMVTRPVFSRVRKEMLLAVLATGAVTLGACSSQLGDLSPRPAGAAEARPPLSPPTRSPRCRPIAPRRRPRPAARRPAARAASAARRRSLPGQRPAAARVGRSTGRGGRSPATRFRRRRRA